MKHLMENRLQEAQQDLGQLYSEVLIQGTTIGMWIIAYFLINGYVLFPIVGWLCALTVVPCAWLLIHALDKWAYVLGRYKMRRAQVMFLQEKLKC